MLLLAASLNNASVMAAPTEPLAANFRMAWWVTAILILVPLYAYLHYLYASMTAQITTLFPVFAAVALVNGVPAMIAVSPLAFFSSLAASLTHYGSGSMPVLFGSGYVGRLAWWRTGFVALVVQIVIWLGIGLVWWQALGVY